MLWINELLMIFSINFRNSALKRVEILEDRLNSSKEIRFCGKNGEKLIYIKHILNIKCMLCINELVMIFSVNLRYSALKRAEIWEDRFTSSREI